ncbi:ATP-binding protein [Sphaerisporangium sp. NPDC051017]|uniref:ATP-binding protein n=1 Tax=Sphaerisporangium sp. NPDC051017 TaxID=3154636 RepID=UPI0034146E9C
MDSPLLLGTLTVPGAAENVAEARRFLMKLLGGDHRDAETVKLLLSELMGNSIRHSASGRGGLVTVAVLYVEGALRVEVADGGGPTVPCLCARGELVESGRGMKLVDVMASRWGFVRDPVEGGTTWFELGETWKGPSESAA